MLFHVLSPSKGRAALIAGALLATSACGGSGAVPPGLGANSGFSHVAGADGIVVVPDDNTSILKKLKKDVVIGSTVDPKNGDKGPRALSRVSRGSGILKKGQLVVCNFEDSAGTAGKGTTVELLGANPGTKPTTFVQNAKAQGCDGDAVSHGDSVYAGGMTSGVVEEFDENAKPKKTYGAPKIEEPLSDADADCSLPYAPEAIYVGDAKTGSIVKFAAGLYGLKKPEAVIEGFATKGSGWSALGPAGIQYNKTLVNRSKCNDTLYIIDGVDDTLVAVSTASNLLTTGEIQVQRGGKTFKCTEKKFTCATLVYAGSPLNAPVALALLPNGNLVVANGKGGNTLVEISAAGKVLATKSLNSDKTAEVYGLIAVGSSDSNTVLYYTDTADNSVHELEP